LINLHFYISLETGKLNPSITAILKTTTQKGMSLLFELPETNLLIKGSKPSWKKQFAQNCTRLKIKFGFSQFNHTNPFGGLSQLTEEQKTVTILNGSYI
jgi:hypothetical protein